MDFAVPADHRVKLKEREKRNRYLDLANELKKSTEHESDSDTNFNWRDQYSFQKIGTGDREIRNTRMSADDPNYCNVENG